MVREGFKTAALCAFYYALAWLTVLLLWPPLSELDAIRQMPAWMPKVIANITAGLLLWTLVHMQRGGMDPRKRTYLVCFGVTCMLFGLSTLHPAQYNEGSACLQLAFFYQTVWAFFRITFGGKKAPAAAAQQ